MRSTVANARLLAPSVAALTVALSALDCGADPSDVSAREFFVSPSGDDSASGRSPSRAWRTVARVNRARLAPGDIVSFRGGRAFRGTLTPRRSGSAGAPITYRSYGGGRASLPGAVWMRSVSHLRFRDLVVDGAPAAFASSRSGSGVRHVSFARTAARNNLTAFRAASPRDAFWIIRDCVVDRTYDSGVHVWAADTRIEGCKISNTGLGHRRYSYSAHGIYSDGARLRVAGNEIWGVADPAGQAISTRYRDAVIEGNHIHDVRHAVGYFRDDAGLGTTTVRGNRFVNVQRWVLYIGPGNRAAGIGENFDVIGNTVVNGFRSPGAAFRWYSTGGRRFVFRDNRVRGFAAVLQSTSGVLASGNVLEL